MLSRPKISPLIEVVKSVTRCPWQLTHLVCVPGRITVLGSSCSASRRPSSWVSSPRMTSGAVASVGVFCRPGTMWSSPVVSSTEVSVPAHVAEVGGQLEVARLGDSLGRTDHSAGEHRQGAVGGEPVADGGFSDSGEVASEVCRCPS